MTCRVKIGETLKVSSSSSSASETSVVCAFFMLITARFYTCVHSYKLKIHFFEQSKTTRKNHTHSEIQPIRLAVVVTGLPGNALPFRILQKGIFELRVDTFSGLLVAAVVETSGSRNIIENSFR